MSKTKYLDNFLNEVLVLEDKHELLEFLKGILTPKELEEIPNRLEIIRLLKQGLPQHQIAEKLGVGVATVTRGSKEIQKGRFKQVKA
jgi:TrpR family trp operon transcriptional repressor